VTFTLVEEVRTYYRKFAKQAGFGVLTRTTKKMNGERSYLILTCSRGRLEQTSTSNSSKPTPTTNRTGGVVLGFVQNMVSCERTPRWEIMYDFYGTM
jgi:hypothetical protein